jgi:hypothetical protein
MNTTPGTHCSSCGSFVPMAPLCNMCGKPLALAPTATAPQRGSIAHKVIGIGCAILLLIGIGFLMLAGWIYRNSQRVAQSKEVVQKAPVAPPAIEHSHERSGVTRL